MAITRKAELLEMGEALLSPEEHCEFRNVVSEKSVEEARAYLKRAVGERVFDHRITTEDAETHLVALGSNLAAEMPAWRNGQQ